MRYLNLKLILSSLLIACAVQASTYYYIRMPDSTYSAQLRGVTGTTSAGQTLTGTWVTGKKAHRFTVTKTGPYKLYADPTGGSSYVLDSAWSGTNGKAVAGDDLATWMLKLNSSYQVKSNGIGDTSIATAKIKNQNVTADKILDSTITLAKLNSTALDYIGSGGSVTNVADDVTLEDNGSALQIKDSGVSGAKVADHAITYDKLDTAAAGFVDVRKFGATGDGVTDDTDAIQAAIDHTKDHGGIVFIPAGTYLVSDQGSGYCLKIYAQTKLYGAGTSTGGYGGSTTIVQDSASNAIVFVNQDYAIQYLSESGSVDYSHHNIIANLHIDCNGDENTTKAWAIAYYRPGENSKIQNITIRDYLGTAVYAEEPTPFTIDNVSIFPSDSASTTERIGVLLKAGKTDIYHISGDDNNPLIKLKQSGAIGVFGLKSETNDLSYGNPVILCDSLSQYSGVNVIGAKASNTSSGNNFIYVVGASASHLPQINIIGCRIENFNNTIYQNLGGTLDSIDTDIRAAFVSWGNGQRYIKGYQNFIEDALSINTSTSKNTLDVYGTVAIGSYGGANTAATNGLLVEGNTAIGATSSGSNKFHVEGNSKLNGRVGVNQALPTRGYLGVTGSAVFDSLFIGSSDHLFFYKAADNVFGIQTLLDGKYLSGYPYGTSSNVLQLQPVVGRVSIGTDASPDALLDVEGGGLLASDSLRVGAGGIWQRNWFYNAADSSLRIVFYNSTLARLDTVVCPQP